MASLTFCLQMILCFSLKRILLLKSSFKTDCVWNAEIDSILSEATKVAIVHGTYSKTIATTDDLYAWKHFWTKIWQFKSVNVLDCVVTQRTVLNLLFDKVLVKPFSGGQTDDETNLWRCDTEENVIWNKINIDELVLLQRQWTLLASSSRTIANKIRLRSPGCLQCLFLMTKLALVSRITIYNAATPEHEGVILSHLKLSQLKMKENKKLNWYWA